MKKGFTLIELLIVVGILAILATTVTLVLNPAELLKQSRDTQRLTDLKFVKQAIDFYLARGTSSHSSGLLTLYFPDPTLCEATTPNTFPGNGGVRATLSGLGGRRVGFVNNAFNTFVYASPGVDEKLVNGNGWVPINFNDLSPTPLPRLPIDPVNIGDDGLTINDAGYMTLATPNVISPTQGDAHFYAYICKGLTYEIIANMESKKYGDPSSPTDVENKDGGTAKRFWFSGLPVMCADPVTSSPVGTNCNINGVGSLSNAATYIADQIYQVGNGTLNF